MSRRDIGRHGRGGVPGIMVSPGIFHGLVQYLITTGIGSQNLGTGKA